MSLLSDFIALTNGKWNHLSAFWVKVNMGQIVKKIAPPPASN